MLHYITELSLVLRTLNYLTVENFYSGWKNKKLGEKPKYLLLGNKVEKNVDAQRKWAIYKIGTKYIYL